MVGLDSPNDLFQWKWFYDSMIVGGGAAEHTEGLHAYYICSWDQQRLLSLFYCPWSSFCTIYPSWCPLHGQHGMLMVLVGWARPLGWIWEAGAQHPMSVTPCCVLPTKCRKGCSMTGQEVYLTHCWLTDMPQKNSKLKAVMWWYFPQMHSLPPAIFGLGICSRVGTYICNKPGWIFFQ